MPDRRFLGFDVSDLPVTSVIQDEIILEVPDDPEKAKEIMDTLHRRIFRAFKIKGPIKL